MMVAIRFLSFAMRRLVILFLLLVYPFQLALAMADRCCDMTPAGVSHHVAAADGAFAAAPSMALQEDEGAGAADPHCAACSFSHTAAAPPARDPLPFAHERGALSAAAVFSPASHPAGRPERPKWPRVCA